MSLPIDAIQQALREDQIDGWLLYDFRGSNAIAQRLAGVEGRHTTRRWYYFIPADAPPRKLVHAIEDGVLDELPGERHTYGGRLQLEAGLASLLAGARTVAMEYSPRAAIPYVSRVDAGTVELVSSLGVRVVSSGDLVGRFEAAWDAAAIDTHRRASEALYRIKDEAFTLVGALLDGGSPVRELEVQARMMQWFQREGLVTDAPPIVAFGSHSGNPHYSPDERTSSLLEPGNVVLLDLWGKLEQPGAVYADITWTGVAGAPAENVETVFHVVTAARDAALRTAVEGIAAGAQVRGWEVDRAARQVIDEAGFGERFVHRTGHSLGPEVHGNGVHMDDYETHDDRRLLTGTGFTIEPGIYLPAFGIRSEINVVVGGGAAEATGPLQRELIRLGRAADGVRPLQADRRPMR